MNHGQAAGLLAGVSDGLVGPVNVFRLEVGNVGLRTAQMPAQFVKAAPLRVLFPLNDELMFLKRDGASWVEICTSGQSRLGMSGHGSQFIERQKLCSFRR